MELKRVASRVVEGLPYLRKELARDLSMKTGLVLAAPTLYYVVFSGKCNLACTFCGIYTLTEPTLSREAMLRIVTETKELSKTGFNISLSGGEPTIYKPLYETLEHAQKLGVNFGFTTNGLALTKDNVKRILSFDPFNINVSLESVDAAVNEGLRPIKDGTRRTLQAIDNLLAEKERVNARVSVIIKPTIMEQNYRKLPDLVRHFRNSKVQINFQPFGGVLGNPHWVKDLDSLARVFDEILALQAEGCGVIGNRDTFDGFFRYLSSPPTQTHMKYLDMGGEKRNCDIGLRSMGIYPNGDIHFCDFLGESIGNIHKNSISEIYYGAIANKQRKGMVHCNIDCQQTCKRKTPLLVKVRAFMRMG